MKTTSQPQSRGFSLVEVLAAVGIIGIIAFLALPNIIAIKQDSERNLAISRAESVNMAIASYVQSKGRTAAVSTWSTLANDSARYAEIAPYLAFAPDNFTDFQPGGFTIDIPDDITKLTKSVLKEGTATISY
ncbi:MAG: type II secretion system protein [Verrucomicrobiales bacterium]|nr:type II secretion system protein [Verrucomicrobiales bacterium]